MFLTSNSSGKFKNPKYENFQYENFQYVTRRQLRRKKKQHKLESKLKIPEKSLSYDKNIEGNHICKADLDEIYGNIAERVNIRSKCQWYEESEKSAKYFLNFEHKQAKKSTIRRLVTDKKDLVEHNDINNDIFSYFKSLFETATHIDKLDHNTLPQSIILPPVTNDQNDQRLYRQRII